MFLIEAIIRMAQQVALRSYLLIVSTMNGSLIRVKSKIFIMSHKAYMYVLEW